MGSYAHSPSLKKTYKAQIVERISLSENAYQKRQYNIFQILINRFSAEEE